MKANIFFKSFRLASCLGLATLMCLGCKPPEQAASSNANTNNNAGAGARGNLPQASVGGGPSAGAAAGGGGDSAASRNRNRDLPFASVGGSTIGVSASDTNSGSNNDSANDNASSTVNDVVIKGAPLNGFFPQTEGFTKNGFGGGLLPQEQGLHRVSPPPAETFASTTDGGGVTDLAPPTITETKSLLNLSEEAFSKRNEASAFKYLYAHLLTDENAQADYPVKWYPSAERGKPPVGPLVAMRWGVGVTYTAPSTFSGKPPVLGDPAPVAAPTSTRGRGRGGNGAGLAGGGGGATPSGDSPYRNVDTSRPEGFLLYYTGEYGDRLLNRLEANRGGPAAQYGRILKDVNVNYEQFETAGQAPAARTNRRRPARRNGDGLSSGLGGPGGGAAGGPAGGGRNRNNDGDGSGGAAEASERVARVSGSSAAAEPDGELTASLMPGVMLLGQAKKDELIERAVAQGLDGLLLFNVRVTGGRKQDCTTSVKVINLHSPTFESVSSGKALKTSEYAKRNERSSGSGGSYVETALKDMFAKADAVFKASDLPALQTKHVQSRIQNLLKDDEIKNPLKTAVEIVSWHQLGLIEDDFAIQSLDKFLNGQGADLLNGDKNSRMAAIMDWLPDDTDEALAAAATGGGGNTGGGPTGGGGNVDGAPLYQTNCNRCHGNDGSGTRRGPDIQGITSTDVIENAIRTGPGRMPSFGRLSDEEVAAIANFVSGF